MNSSKYNEQAANCVKTLSSDESDEDTNRVIANRIEFKNNQDSDEEERTQIREELSSLPFNELMKLKETLGSKVYNEAIFGSSSKTEKQKPKTKIELKRLNKNRPREMSSKRPVPLLGNDKLSKKSERIILDPRFDEKCGQYNTKIFKDNYNFITDIRTNEINELNKELKETKTDDEKQQIKLFIQKLENQNREESERKIRESVLSEEMREINKAKREGKPVHYPTKKERRTKELVKRYETLKQSGRLGKHLEKQRKKNKARDRKRVNFD